MRIFLEKQKQTFGDWLKETRIRKDIGVRELASLTDGACSASYVSYLERNVYSGKEGNPTRPSELIVEALARGLEVPLNEARLAAGYVSLRSLTPEREFLRAFLSLSEGYGMLSPDGKEVAEREVDQIIRSLMEMEGVSFSQVRGAKTNYQPATPPKGLEVDEFTIDLRRPEPDTGADVDREANPLTVGDSGFQIDKDSEENVLAEETRIGSNS